jgi:beta-glucosidase
MLEAVKQGLVKESTISLAVGRVLVQMEKFGLLDRAPKHDITEVDYSSHIPVLRKTAEDAATLLKNDDRVLPITAADLDSTVFIGPTGGILVSVGQSGERAMGLPDHHVGPVPALEQIAGRKVRYYPANDFDGSPIPASALSNLARSTTGTGQRQNDAELNFTTANGKALPPGTSYTWEGTLNAPVDGTYMLALQTRGATGTVTVDGQQVIGGGGRGSGGGRGGQGGPPISSLPGLKGTHPISGNITPTADHLNNSRTKTELKAGAHEITVTVSGEQYGFPVQARLAWVTPQQDKANYEAAVNAAKQASKAVVFAWGRDRPQVFALTPEQNRLIQDVAAVNANTIVVLNTSLPVEMPWIRNVKGLLQAWWPGDEGGPAMANVLLGKANPAGRLPITWPVKLSDMVAQDPANHPERTNSGLNGKTTYSEGIFVGYRWYDKQNIAPLFPFGHGLSYTTFEYSGLKVAKARAGGLDVSFTITNTGKVDGDEVPQVYVGAPKNPPAGPQFALRSLAQFDRVSIRAGKSRTLTLHVAPRSLQYWSTAQNKWMVPPGARTVYVGSSSRLVRLQADVIL